MVAISSNAPFSHSFSSFWNMSPLLSLTDGTMGLGEEI